MDGEDERSNDNGFFNDGRNDSDKDEDEIGDDCSKRFNGATVDSGSENVRIVSEPE